MECILGLLVLAAAPVVAFMVLVGLPLWLIFRVIDRGKPPPPAPRTREPLARGTQAARARPAAAGPKMFPQQIALVAFVSSARNAGHPEAAIAAALKAKGWPEAEISRAFDCCRTVEGLSL